MQEMKRAREDHPEGGPPTKHSHVELTFGPFTATNNSWSDFWLETLQYLTPSDLWKLSCVCKNTFSLVWSLLLPNSENGLRFFSTPSVAEHLSRTPSLKHLHFTKGTGYQVLTALTALSSLSHLHLPPNNDEDETPFPLESVKHLTGLTGLGEIPLIRPDMLPVLQHFKDLKVLHVDCPYGYGPLVPLLLYFKEMTTLEDLSIVVERTVRIENIAPFPTLTRLKRLYLSSGRGGDLGDHLGLSGFTNLTYLYSFDAHLPYDDLQHLTNLRHIEIPLGRAQGKELEHIEQLTNLTYLEADISQSSIPSLPLLTNLKTLKVPGWNFHLGDKTNNLPATYEHFRHISDLTLFHGNGLHPEQVRCFEVGEFPNLTKLTCSGGTMPTELIARLTNLTKLNHLEVSMNFGALDLSPISHLTNLRTINSLPGDLLTNREDLKLLPTSLTSLDFGWNKLSEEDFASCSGLTGLTKLILQFNGSMSKPSVELIAKTFPQLKELDLANLGSFKPPGDAAAVEQEQIEGLKPLFGLTGLEKLEIRFDESQIVKRFWNARRASQGPETDILFSR